MLLVAGLVFGGTLFSQVLKNSAPEGTVSAQTPDPATQTQHSTTPAGEKTPVQVMASRAYGNRQLFKSLGLDEKARILIGEVAFHHNGTVIACDSAVQYSNSRIDCFKNVIINKDSTFVYGDRAEYNGDRNIATVFSPVVKVTDGDATLYTATQFTFNTADNIGSWNGGGVIYQQDNVLESERGIFYSDLHEMVGVRNVEMRNDDHELISDSVRYNTETRIATFYTRTYIWTDEGEMISALKGRYNAQDSTYFFHDNAYVLDRFRESWADTIDFNARARDAFFYGNVQINDEEHDSSAFGDFGQYLGERGETMLTRWPSLLNYDADQGNADTLYMRADTIRMFVRYPSDSGRRRDSLTDAGDAVDRFAHLRWIDSLSDSVRVVMADSLSGVIDGLRSRIDELKQRADGIMAALYPAPPVDTSEPADTLSMTGSLPTPDSLSQPENPAPPEVVELRLQIDELTTEADSLASVEEYVRPRGSETGRGLSAADSLELRRLDSIARADSLHRVDSIRTADPKAYRAMQKAEARRLKAEKKRLEAEAREARYAAKAADREEKQRLRADRRAAKEAARAARIAARRRSFRRQPGAEILDSLAHRDSLSVADSLRLVDSLFRVDSLWRVDSLAHVSTRAATDTTADTTYRIFRGWYDVRIWRKDMQAVCDSMVGFSVDSTVHLYIDPILWHADNQITSDSIILYTASQQIEHAEFYGNPIMSSQIGGSGSRQFNQVRGKYMSSWFRDGELRRHDVNENAQSLYYMQEEEEDENGRTVMSSPFAFVVSSAVNMSFFFESDSLRYIAERQNSLYTAYPIDQIPGTQPTRLQGFGWHLDRKPALADVFSRRVRPSEREWYEALPHPTFPIAARIERRREFLIENRMWADRNDPLPAYAVEFRRLHYRPEAQ
jgi:hypothetical protein